MNIRDGAATETVLPTSSICTVGGPAPCHVSARFAYPHGARLSGLPTSWKPRSPCPPPRRRHSPFPRPLYRRRKRQPARPCHPPLSPRRGRGAGPSRQSHRDGRIQAGNFLVFAALIVTDAAMTALPSTEPGTSGTLAVTSQLPIAATPPRHRGAPLS